MIKAYYQLDADEHFTKLIVTGHAEAGEYGQDLVCASASCIVFGLMNALDAEGGNSIIQDTNMIHITVNEYNPKIDNYFNLVLFQLKTIEESYGRYIKVERKN